MALTRRWQSVCGHWSVGDDGKTVTFRYKGDTVLTVSVMVDMDLTNLHLALGEYLSAPRLGEDK